MHCVLYIIYSFVYVTCLEGENKEEPNLDWVVVVVMRRARSQLLNRCGITDVL